MICRCPFRLRKARMGVTWCGYQFRLFSPGLATQSPLSFSAAFGNDCQRISSGLRYLYLLKGWRSWWPDIVPCWNAGSSIYWVPFLTRIAAPPRALSEGCFAYMRSYPLMLEWDLGEKLVSDTSSMSFWWAFIWCSTMALLFWWPFAF